MLLITQILQILKMKLHCDITSGNFHFIFTNQQLKGTSMRELDRQIGKRLQQARKKSGYRSARAFAREHQIPESTYSQHETGKRSLSPKMLTQYCQCLGIQAGWLVSGESVSPEKGIFELEKTKQSLLFAVKQVAGIDISRCLTEVSECFLKHYQEVVQAEIEEAVAA